MTAKEKYRDYCKTAKDVSLFQQDWWLDAVCGTQNWDAIIYENNGNILGAWAYPIKKKYNLQLITMPMLTMGTGPIIHFFPGQKPATQLSHEQQVLDELITQLPKFDLFDLYFLPQYKNHLSFHWKGFTQSTRYTYLIKDLSNLDVVFENFNSSIRTQIRKAEKEINIIESNDIELFYKINSLSFKKQNKKVPHSLAYLKQINDACIKNKCRKILFAKDPDNNIHAAVYIAWDNQSAYYVNGGADETFKSSGAYSLLLWHAIKIAAGLTKEFNFCGSMLPNVERFFRSFGGEQTPYLHLKKVNSKALKLFLALKEK
ncbi:MAG TPA: GNAT family N-acetyltransferase [Bacteroidia bacterium]|nr:GNAT family N-acetyltransferase [Bacteroidia bacterium]